MSACQQIHHEGDAAMMGWDEKGLIGETERVLLFMGLFSQFCRSNKKVLISFFYT